MAVRPPLIDIYNKGGGTRALEFSTNGDYLLSADDRMVSVWRVEDGKQVTGLVAPFVNCLAVSQDGSRIAAGTAQHEVLVWDAKTYEMAFSHAERTLDDVNGVHFSPVDSTRLLVASRHCRATVWNVVTREPVVGPLYQERAVRAGVYSPKGDRIATATHQYIRVYDGSDGRLLVDISGTLKVTPWYNTSLLWSGEHLFVISDSSIKQFESSTGSLVSEWPVPTSDRFSCIALPRHGEFIAYSTNYTVTFWDTLTHVQIGLINHQQEILSISLSPDGRSIAIGGDRGKITIRSLSGITDSIPLSRLHRSFQEPAVQIDDDILDLWKKGRLASAEASLTTAVSASQDPNHHVLASRALVRARLRQWDAAMSDAEKSIEIQPSVIGYIAKSMALVGNGDKNAGYRACDIALEHFHSIHVSFLLLIKAIIVFMAGEHDDAISRTEDLIDNVHFNTICYVVQAYMYLLVGNSHMENGNYDGAIRAFERARAQVRQHASEPLAIVSLIFGWTFDGLSIKIQQCLCEAMLAAGRAIEGSELALRLVSSFCEDAHTSASITSWVSNFACRCLSAPLSSSDAEATRNNRAPTIHAILDTVNPIPLLREWAKATLVSRSWEDSLVSTVTFMAPRFTIYRAICERLETINRILDASKCFRKMTSELTEAHMHEEQMKWAHDFRGRCHEKLGYLGDVKADAQQHDDAIIFFSAAISVGRCATRRLFIKRSKAYMAKGLWEEALEDAKEAIIFESLGCEEILIEWLNLNLTNGIWKGILSAARDFNVPRLAIYRALCAGLEKIEGVMDAVECFHQMEDGLSEEVLIQSEHEEWVRDFKYRCSQELERLGDSAMETRECDEALKCYSAGLSVQSPDSMGFFIMRSKVCMAKRSWEGALDDANKAIAVSPLSPRGYEARHAVLHGSGRYVDAIDTFEMMLSKIAQSPDPKVRELHGQYNHPTSTREVIRRIVRRTIRHSPRVLIDMSTGRLQDKDEQAFAFESQPVFNELVSSMTTRVDRARIKREVRGYFRYVMLSHTWEANEPLFQQLIHMAVHDLDQSPTHDKLKMFCKIVRDAGFKWAWSDTCCIDKQDHFILQEALVAMFKWYRGAAMVIVFLRGVCFPAKLGDLIRSIWNTRGWTLQEYVAAKVIRFYTEDWKPYLNPDITNHKESPVIISEMEQATRVSTQQLMSLRPGLSSIREKLRLASTRQTTFIEDAAYSLLGIFSVTGIPAIYGEGEGALGRLLAHLLSGSGDVSILAWSGPGESSSFNSCLPARITVFNRSATSHLPQPIEDTKLDEIVATLRTSSLEIELAIKLYNRLDELPSPWFAASRMKLPCISFKLPSLSPSRAKSGMVYRTETPSFGLVEIKTRQDLTYLNSLYLVHPWLDSLLDHEDMQGGAFVEDDHDITELSSPVTDDEDMLDDEIDEDTTPFPVREHDLPSSPPVETMKPMDRETRALRLIARLRQPFGAFLFTLVATRRRSVVYRRIATDSVITVQMRESVTLGELLENVRILDVL